MTKDDWTTNRIADLKRKLNARKGKYEFRENVEDLKKEIARLEARNGG